MTRDQITAREFSYVSVAARPMWAEETPGIPEAIVVGTPVRGAAFGLVVAYLSARWPQYRDQWAAPEQVSHGRSPRKYRGEHVWVWPRNYVDWSRDLVACGVWIDADGTVGPGL